METVLSNRGGWFAERLPTGALFGVKNLLAAGTVGLLVSTGTGAYTDALAQLQQQRVRESLISSPTINYVAEVRNVRTAIEDLKRIREVLSPAISDIAKCFQVSRQSIYNWLNGEQPSAGHVVTLRDLALAADMLSESGMSISGYTLKRKFANGKNLFEVVQNGESASNAARLLLHILSQEARQRDSLSARFAGRSTSKGFVDSDLMQANDKA